ncbi:hypothetical protein Q1695_007868 [Nippostrongylus brasiliensis]|nr:hypothetical protein Q1695_007868 [Nippostrongylus brasiliensis]
MCVYLLDSLTFAFPAEQQGQPNLNHVAWDWRAVGESVSMTTLSEHAQLTWKLWLSNEVLFQVPEVYTDDVPLE